MNDSGLECITNHWTIDHFPIAAHNALCLPPKFCITYRLKMLLGKCNTSQEHLKTMVYAEFGGQTECIMGNWKIENTDSFIFNWFVRCCDLKWQREVPLNETFAGLLVKLKLFFLRNRKKEKETAFWLSMLVFPDSLKTATFISICLILSRVCF